MYDISIIGAGVIGLAIARELAKYNLKICVIEKEEDVATGATKANSGIVHGGYAAKHGTLKGELCIKGNQMYPQLEEELNFGFRRTGALVVGFSEEDKEKIKDLYENGLEVGCKDLEIIYSDKIKEIEPHINKDVKIALYSRDVGVASPYELAIALAENAMVNGVELKLENKVLGIEKVGDYFHIRSNQGSVKSKFIINAAGLYSDKIANMVGIEDFQILPRRGQYLLFGKDQGYLVNSVIFQVPTVQGKGILVTTTYHGNFMIGPNAEEIDDKDDVATTIESLENVIETAKCSIPGLDVKKALTTFSGVRASSSTGDFIIEESKVKSFINVAGIDSPGLTAAPAIAEKVVAVLKDTGLSMVMKEEFNPYRKAILTMKPGDFDGKPGHKDKNKNVICRCERITEAEIIDAIQRGIPIKSIDAIKRRTRAGMGFCQGSFCRPKVQEIIARERQISLDEITLRGKNAPLNPKRVDMNVIRKYKR